MDKYKLKFTRLQNEILGFLNVRYGDDVNQRMIASGLGVSPTAVSKAVRGLEEKGFVVIRKNKTMNFNLVELNREDWRMLGFRRTENLRMIYFSGLVDFLEERFPGSLIVLFGSYGRGEDTVRSDIDVAIVGCKERSVDLKKFEDFFEKEIRVNFYDSLSGINKNLRSNIFNGIVLVGGISL